MGAIETRTAKIYLDENGVLRIVFTAALDSGEDERENIEAIDKITEKQKYPLLIDFSGVTEIPPLSRKFFESKDAFNPISAMAVLLGPAVSKMTEDFFTGLMNQPGLAMKLFNDEDKALLWLNSFISARFEAEQYAVDRKISILEFKDTKTSFIISCDDGIIRISSFWDTHTLEDAKEVISAFKLIAKDKKHPVLVDSSRAKDMSPESMKFYGSDEAMISVSAIAIIIKSGISRVMANFFMDISKRKFPPRRLFNDENKAVEWLKTFMVSNSAGETEQINVLVYEPVSQMQKPIIYTLIKNGIKCLCLQDKKFIINKLNSKKFNAFICNCPPGATEIIGIIKEIRQDSGLNSVKIVLWTDASYKSFFEEMIRIGINGIILKPFVEEVFEQSILKILYGKGGVPDRRRIIRVEPDAGDRTIVAIRSTTTHKTVVGKVKSLSMEGMAIELTGELTDEDLREKEVITNNNIKITLNENDISTNGVIFKRKQNMAVIKFYEMQDYYKNMLSSYIYGRLGL